MSEEKKEPIAHIVAYYTCSMSWSNLSDVIKEYFEENDLPVREITVDDIDDIYIKHGELTIELKTGEEIYCYQGTIDETDYKWPVGFNVYDVNWRVLKEG